MKRYRVTERLRWLDDNNVEHFHEATFFVKPFEGKRPKGRVYENGDMWMFDGMVSETDKPPYIWAWKVETTSIITGAGKVPANWELVEGETK
ncbi:hypothetical protein P0D88_31550 [Paraburkholderia sp. RL18-103-BIB-C]|uniref:hypothetical protein n=1 Tax=Paraburkholderia sp. RL18-103-BIB-C TaxID=3031637 RepID=UPI0038B8F46D